MYTMITWKEEREFVNIYLLSWRRLEYKLTRTINRRHSMSPENIKRTNNNLKNEVHIYFSQ